MTDQTPILTPARLAEIEARTRAATPGPWDWVDYGEVITRDEHDSIAMAMETTMGHTNAAFIAHARTDIPALLSHLRALEAENARLRALLMRVTDHLEAKVAYDHSASATTTAAIFEARAALQPEPKEPQ